MATTMNRAASMYDDHMAAALMGDADAYFELGIAFSTGTHGCGVDLIEAHKWFNLAALSGIEEGAHLRSDVATEMTPSDIAQAQKAARAWLTGIKTGALTAPIKPAARAA